MIKSPSNSGKKPFDTLENKKSPGALRTLLTLRLNRYQEIIPDFKSFLESCEDLPEPVIRVNSLKGSEESLIRELENESVKLNKINDVPGAYRWLNNKKGPGTRFQAAAGAYYIQALSSFFPSLWLSPKPGEKVLDLCAAPGGKTTHLAELMKDEGLLIANDRKKKRIQTLNANLDRCGVTRALTTLYRGQEFPETGFDKILVDAPCSAEGTFRFQKPAPIEFKKKKREKSFLKTITSQQKGLLHRGFQCLKEGGELIYSTCTYAPEENEEVIQDLLDAHPDAELLPCQEKWLFRYPFERGLTQWNSNTLSKTMRHCLRLYPHKIPSLGFFIAKVKKND